jgi:hypothetical protein
MQTIINSLSHNSTLCIEHNYNFLYIKFKNLRGVYKINLKNVTENQLINFLGE